MVIKNNTITILGCGSSAGVPTIENGWGNCNPNNPKNSRTRSSVLINLANFHILIDTSPDLRQQALANNIKQIDTILYTHEHSDHIAGIHDIRAFNRLMNKAIDCYLDHNTYRSIKSIFNYVFTEPNVNASASVSRNFYKPALIPHIITHNSTLTLHNNQIRIKVLHHIHGTMKVVGYKFNNKFAYITDILDFADENTINEYKNLDILVISACVLKPHSSHMRFIQVIEMIQTILKPKRAFLTHMSEYIDYDIQTNYLKSLNINNIFLCYDGLQIDI